MACLQIQVALLRIYDCNCPSTGNPATTIIPSAQGSQSQFVQVSLLVKVGPAVYVSEPYQ